MVNENEMETAPYAESDDATRIAANIAAVEARIMAAAERAGRSTNKITLIAVTKTQPLHRIEAAYRAGIRHFGENYVQEMRTKLGQPSLLWPDAEWHFIGHLQRNKARDIFLSPLPSHSADEPTSDSSPSEGEPGRNDARFALIPSVDSVDSVPLAEELGRRASQHAAISPITLPILLEVKLDPGPTKFGFEPDKLLEEVEQICAIPGIALRGLMGMAPFSADPEEARPYFKRLYKLFQALPKTCQQHLSMGMTGDFEVAIEEGATQVRIGTALFGPRLKR